MMSRFNALGVSVLVALAVVAITAGSASAAKILELNASGVPVAKGTTVFAGLATDGCVTFTEGKLTANGASKDVATFKNNAFTECEEGTSLSGGATEVQIKSSGKASFKAKITISQPGPCVYALTKFATTFPVPGETLGDGEATAKLDKPASNASCAKSLKAPFETDVANGVFGSPFETELRG
jgi:hypothetical protein